MRNTIPRPHSRGLTKDSLPVQVGAPHWRRLNVLVTMLGKPAGDNEMRNA